MPIKPIQFRPTKHTAERVEQVAERLRTSKAAVVELAVETILEAFDAEEASVVNGKIVFSRSTKKAA